MSKNLAVLFALAAFVVGCATEEPPATKVFDSQMFSLSYKKQADGTFVKAECLKAEDCAYLKDGNNIGGGMCDLDNPISGKTYCYAMPKLCKPSSVAGHFDCTATINAATACLGDDDCDNSSANAQCKAKQCVFFAMEDPAGTKPASVTGTCNVYNLDAKDAALPAPVTCGKGACEATVQKCQGGVFTANPTCTPGPAAGGEVCDDVDNTCDGTTDEGCDDDNDDYCDDKLTLGAAGSKLCPKGGGDCNDAVATINKGVAESVCDDVDQNCNGVVDEGCDDDKDLYCDVTATVASGPAPKSCPKGGGDCSDTDNTRHPTATESCDGIDSNCDGKSDTGDGVYKIGEACSNGVGACGVTGKFVCSADKTTSACDSTPKPTPVPQTESVCDNLDNDCDGLVDEACDSDDDDYCDAKMTFVASNECKKGGGDCLDKGSSNAKSVNPAASETCNGNDDNCNGSVDEPTGATTVTCGVGACAVTVPWCSSGSTPQCTPKGTGGQEVCGNGLDDDCDSVVDEADACGVCEMGLPVKCMSSSDPAVKFNLATLTNEELWVQAQCPTSGGTMTFKSVGRKQVIDIQAGPTDKWSLKVAVDSGFVLSVDLNIAVNKLGGLGECKADKDLQFSDAIKDTLSSALCLKATLKNLTGTGPARVTLFSPTNKTVTGSVSLGCTQVP